MLTEVKPIEHFKDLVSSAIKHQKIQTNEMAEFYLSSLLANFIFTEKLSSEPLAITYIKALGSGKEVQIRHMKQLGDLSLFTSGFFSDSLKRKIVDIDYYMSMGISSYSYVASIHKEGRSASPLSALFSELAEKFGLFVDVLTEVSEKSRLTSSKDILRVYERWLRTKSAQAERMLRELGIEPHNVSTSTLQ
ncbi:MAG: hypothetical protein HY954_09700 [Deltaproteobacteria bacterium]|nr:hypothetical protein [Deltaproteobacteria bacterium]